MTCREFRAALPKSFVKFLKERAKETQEPTSVIGRRQEERKRQRRRSVEQETQTGDASMNALGMVGIEMRIPLRTELVGVPPQRQLLQDFFLFFRREVGRNQIRETSWMQKAETKTETKK
jgi:hypothetical protein